MGFATEKEAYALLEELAISYQRFDHPAITSAQDLKFSLPGQQVKNILLKSKTGHRYYLVILPIQKQAHLSELANSLGEKRLSFASTQELEDLLHVPAGTVTPFGLMFDQDRKVKVILDTELDSHLPLGFHPFSNATTLNIAYADVEKVLEKLGHKPQYLTC